METENVPDGSEGRARAVVITKFLNKKRGGALRRDDARNLLRRTLESQRARRGLVVHAWAFLPSKVVLLVQLPAQRPLATSLGELFGYYTRRFNARYRRSGPVFRARFLKSVLFSDEEILRAIARIHAMPAEHEVEECAGAEPHCSRSVYLGTPDRITTPWVPGTTQRVSTASSDAPFAPLNFVDAENASDGSAGMVTER